MRKRIGPILVVVATALFAVWQVVKQFVVLPSSVDVTLFGVQVPAELITAYIDFAVLVVLSGSLVIQWVAYSQEKGRFLLRTDASTIVGSAAAYSARG